MLLDVYKKLSTENVDRIYMKNSKHALNMDNVKNFVEKQCHPKAQEFARFVVDNITHVSFETFLTKIQIMANELLETSKGSKIVFVIPNYYLYKSNFWVSLLLYEELKKKNADIYDITDDFNVYLTASDNTVKYTFVIMDDCSYSGRQLTSDLKVKDGVKIGESKLFVFVPYISYYAKDRFSKDISDTSHIIYPQSVTYFENFWQICKTKKFNPFAHDLFYSEITDKQLQDGTSVPLSSMIFDFYKFYQATSLIYFDHKIADLISVAQCLLNYGALFNKHKILEQNDAFNSNLEYMQVEFDGAETLEEISDVIQEYKNNILQLKDPNMGNTPLSMLVNLEGYYSEKNCYKPKPNSDYVQNEDYFPLITSDGNCKPVYHGCVTDLNEYSDAMCLKTFYKNIDYTLDGKNVKDLANREEIDKIKIPDLMKSTIGGFIGKINISYILIIAVILMLLMLLLYIIIPSKFFEKPKTQSVSM